VRFRQFSWPRAAMDAVALHHAAVPVPRQTAEWGWLEYLLQVSMQSTRVRLRAAWSVANKRLAVQCAKRCRGLLTLYAWVPVSELGAADSVQAICQNGFRVGHRGVSFHIGNVRLPGTHGYGKDTHMGRSVRSRGRNLPQGRRLYEFLLCRVGVGRSYLIESVDQAESLDMPPEYDSFFVRHDTNADKAEEEHFGVYPRHMLHHEYIVRDAAQALPLYFLHFEYDPEAEEKLALPLCDACGTQAAKLYCEADDANFCPSCDTRVHAVNTIARNHTRVEVNRRPNRAKGACPEHLETEADEYCTECRRPLCVHCRQLGSHSAGEAAKHKRVPLMEAYHHALEARPRGVPGMSDRQIIEQRLVAQLDGKLAQVQESGRAAEDAIYQRVQGLVREAQDLAEEQASMYLSDELEAKRRMEEAAWIESYFEEVGKQTPAPEFLRSWLLHTELRDDLAALGSTHRPHVGAGLRVDGGFKLAAGEAGATMPQRPGVGAVKRTMDMREHTSPRFILDA